MGIKSFSSEDWMESTPTPLQPTQPITVHFKQLHTLLFNLIIFSFGLELIKYKYWWSLNDLTSHLVCENSILFVFSYLFLLISFIHIKPFMPHTKSNTQPWVKKGSFIHKCQKINSLTIGGSTLSAYNSMLLLLLLTLTGPSTCMYPHICYLIRNNMYINIHVSLQVCLNTRQQEQLSF